MNRKECTPACRGLHAGCGCGCTCGNNPDVKRNDPVLAVAVLVYGLALVGLVALLFIAR